MLLTKPNANSLTWVLQIEFLLIFDILSIFIHSNFLLSNAEWLACKNSSYGIEKISKLLNFQLTFNYHLLLHLDFDPFKNNFDWIVELVKLKPFRRWVRYGLSSKYACDFKSRVLFWWWPTRAFIAHQNALLRLRKWWLWEGQRNVFKENVDFFHRQHDKTNLSDSQGLSRGRMPDR